MKKLLGSPECPKKVLRTKRLEPGDINPLNENIKPYIAH